MIRYQLKVHKEGSSYWGEFLDLPGCFTQGKTKKELVDNAKESLSLYLEESRSPKWVLPKAKKRRGDQYVWIEPDFQVSIALMIRTARINKGLTQKALASAIGITFQQLQNLENPKRSNPTVKTLRAISEALNETLEIQISA